MKNILALIGLVVVGFFGLGWYLGWYKMATERNPDGTRGIDLDVNTKKITTDIQKGGQKIEQLITPGGSNNNSTPTPPSSSQEQPRFKVGENGEIEFVLPPLPKLEVK